MIRWRLALFWYAAAMLALWAALALFSSGTDCPRGSVTSSGIAWCK